MIVGNDQDNDDSVITAHVCFKYILPLTHYLVFLLEVYRGYLVLSPYIHIIHDTNLSVECSTYHNRANVEDIT